MPLYRHSDARGQPDEITVIEDANMVEEDPSGSLRPTFAFIDPFTVRAHPLIIDSLLEEAERLWSLDELLSELAP